MSGREAIFSALRGRLVQGDDQSRRAAVTERLAGAPAGIIPARGQLAEAERIALFVTMAVKVAASVARVASFDEVPGAVAAYLREKNLPASVRMGADPRLSTLPWARESALEIKTGPSDGLDEAGVSHALGAIAETGTLALASGPDNPVTISFLPEHHIVVLDARDVAGDMEAVFAAVAARYGKGTLPRTLNLVTGPSRSGDIEQTIILGAHGPRALHVVLVDETAG